MLPPYPHLYHSAMYHLWHCHKTLAKQSNILYDHQQTNEHLLYREARFPLQPNLANLFAEDTSSNALCD